jgi:hypothetical protein
MNKYLILTLLSSFSLFCYCYNHKRNIDHMTRDKNIKKIIIKEDKINIIKIKEEDKIIVKPILKKINFNDILINKTVSFKNPDKLIIEKIPKKKLKLVVYNKPKPIYKYFLVDEWEVISNNEI